APSTWLSSFLLLRRTQRATLFPYTTLFRSTRAALAAGRIGDEGAVLPLIDLLKKDTDWGAQQMAAFALGEIESAKATDALIEASRISDLRARALEALGKIAAALPPTEEQRRQAIGQVVLDALVIERKEAMPTE